MNKIERQIERDKQLAEAVTKIKEAVEKIDKVISLLQEKTKGKK